MARQRKAMLVVLAAAGLVAAACSGPPTSGSGEQPDVAAGGGEAALPDCPLDALDEATGPVEVTLWYGGIGGVTKETMENMVDGFNASQDEVHVTASDQGSSYAEVYRKFESAASANTDQLPDVVLLENTQLQVLADGGLILPAQACMEAAGYEITDIEPAVRSAYSVGGVLYPGYANVSSQVLYYNKAHWVEAGLDPAAPPQTLEEIYEQAKKLKAAGVSDKPLAFKISAAVFENWLSGDGIDVVNNNNGHDGQATEATFDTPEAHDALALLKRMNDEGLVNVFASTEGGCRPVPGAGDAAVLDAHRDLGGGGQHRRGPRREPDRGRRGQSTSTRRSSTAPSSCPVPGCSRGCRRRGRSTPAVAGSSS